MAHRDSDPKTTNHHSLDRDADQESGGACSSDGHSGRSGIGGVAFGGADHHHTQDADLVFFLFSYTDRHPCMEPMQGIFEMNSLNVCEKERAAWEKGGRVAMQPVIAFRSV